MTHTQWLLGRPGFLSLSQNPILPPGDTMARRNRSSRGGGVALVLKEYLTHSVLEVETHTESRWVKTEPSSPPLVLGAVYHLSNSHLDMIQTLHDFIGNLVRKYKLVIVAAGDFNLAYIDWERGLVTRSACDSFERLIDIYFNPNLTQTVKTATRLGRTASLSWILCLFLLKLHQGNFHLMLLMEFQTVG